MVLSLALSIEIFDTTVKLSTAVKQVRAEGLAAPKNADMLLIDEFRFRNIGDNQGGKYKFS